MTTDNPITDLLRAPLGPDWTVERLAEQVLDAIAARGPEEAGELVLDADALTDRQSRRLLRPLLACLATKSAAEAGTPAHLYGGHFSFERRGTHGPERIIGDFENRPGRVRVTLRRFGSPDVGTQSRATGLPGQIESAARDAAAMIAASGDPVGTLARYQELLRAELAGIQHAAGAGRARE